jgi:hypothetical protein
MQVEKNDKGETILLFGENEADINNIEDSQNAIINFLVGSKRHQIKINPKFATDNTKTNLKSNNADYLKYLIDNGILTTNAVVNEPTFQGYTNIYLNTGITITNQPKVSESGVEVDNNNFGDLNFDDKQTVTQPISGLQITYTPTGKQSQTYTVNKNKIFNSKGEEVFKIDSADRRKIFANVAVKEGRAKVIEDNKGVKYVVNNKQQIMSTATGKIMAWDDNHATRKLLLDKYNKLVQSSKPKISENGVEVSADDTGLNDLFENNQENVRNVQENFVSLSEI